LLKITPPGVSLWHFHVYMYYNPNGFIPLVFFFFPFYLSPVLMVISIG
jgi:hypothetical protein